MEQKFKEYRKFDWTLSDAWQTYLNNIFPTPSRDRLEKIRRKWYRDNQDKQFDITWEPSASSNAESGDGSSQQRAGGASNPYQQFMNQQQQYMN